MSRKIKQHRVPLDLPATLAQTLEDGAAGAGLTLDDFLCKVL